MRERLAVVYAAYNTPDGDFGHKYGYRLLDTDGDDRGQLAILNSYFGGFRGERPML